MAETDAQSSQAAVEGETPSPLCNHLLDQARLRLAGEVSEEELRGSVAGALQSLDQARQQTLQNLENDGAKDDVLDAFERSFEDMQVALEDLDEFASAANEESHESVRESILRAATATVYAMTTLQQSQFQEGPTDMPLFNALFKMKEGFLEGGVEADQLKQALAGIVDMTKKAIEELLQAEGEQPPQRDGLVRAYEQQIESLEKAGESVEAGDEQQIEAVFSQLLETSNAVKEAIGSLNHALMSAGPCRMERTNVLLSAAEMFFQGTVGPEAFAESVEAFEAQLREEYSRFQALASQPNDSEAVQAEIAGVKEAYELHEDALALFSEILEGEVEPEEFSNAKQGLIEASEKLSDHKEKLLAIADNEGKVSCVRCGAANEAGSKVCNSCGAQLPQQAAVGASTMSYQESDGNAIFGSELEMTTNLERLFHAVNDISEERCSDEEFEEVLVWMDNLLANAEATMPEIPDLTNHPFGEEEAEKINAIAEQLHEQRNNMLSGMADFRVALGTLQSFFQSRSDEDLKQGVREVQSAALRMQQSENALTMLIESVAEANRKAEAERQAAQEQGESSGE